MCIISCPQTRTRDFQFFVPARGSIKRPPRSHLQSQSLVRCAATTCDRTCKTTEPMRLHLPGERRSRFQLVRAMSGGGVTPALLCCADTLQRRSGSARWRVLGQFCHSCNAASEFRDGDGARGLRAAALRVLRRHVCLALHEKTSDIKMSHPRGKDERSLTTDNRNYKI